MAVPVSYSPQSVIARAMFNFDVFGGENFRLDGTVRVSVSDAFTSADYASTAYSYFYTDLWTRGSAEVYWTPTQLENIGEVLDIYARYADINFQWSGDFDAFSGGSDTTVNPEDVGRLGRSDINLTLINRRDADFAGISGWSTDDYFGYEGGAEDIFINMAAASLSSDSSFAEGARARQTLMHELGHSLGMSHPHTAYNNGAATISVDFAAMQFVGFSKLGFRTDSAADMNKEYFTIMSYDDQDSVDPNSNVSFSAFTPMILDVIALQEAYGEGAGTSGPGNDTIEAGNVGYRTYFDPSGIDTIDLAFYYDGAYLDMGEDIAGAPHKVGVATSLNDGLNTILHGGGPQHLRWFYGEYENAIGSPSGDLIVDNSLDNSINGAGGDDYIVLQRGNDTVDGGSGIDTADYSGDRAAYVLTGTSTGFALSGGGDGPDALTGIERLQFADTRIALDLDGAAGDSVRVIGAAFGAHYLTDKALVGVGLSLFDSGTTREQVAEIALGSALFEHLAGSRGNAAVVTLLYDNVFGRVPSDFERDYFVGVLDRGMSQTDLLLLAANSDFNGVRVDIAGLAQTGIEYA